MFVLPCLASSPFYHFYPLLQSNKTSTVPTSFFLLQGNFVLPSLFSFLLIVFIYFFLHVFYSSSLFSISLFSYSLVSSLSPPRTHAHRLQTSCAGIPALAKLPFPYLTKLGTTTPSQVLHSQLWVHWYLCKK